MVWSIYRVSQEKSRESGGDVVKEGDEVSVKVVGFFDRGKVKLSMKQA